MPDDFQQTIWRYIQEDRTLTNFHSRNISVISDAHPCICSFTYLAVPHPTMSTIITVKTIKLTLTTYKQHTTWNNHFRIKRKCHAASQWSIKLLITIIYIYVPSSAALLCTDCLLINNHNWQLFLPNENITYLW
jgi:hypothetical protein